MKNLAYAIAFALTALSQPAGARISDTDGQCVIGFDEEFIEIIPHIASLSDPQTFAATINDPEQFFDLLDALNNPLAFPLMSKCATETALWDHWVETIANPDRIVAAMFTAMNPEGLADWAVAPLDADIWRSAASHADPQRYVDWANAATTRDFYAPMIAMTDPDWIARRLTWMSSAESYAPITDALGLTAQDED